MKTQHLQYLIEIAKSGSLTAASEKMFITQQALSNVVKNIEEELNTKVLERNAKGVQFTPEGKIVLAYAHEALNGYEKMLSDISKIQTEYYDLKGNLVVYYAPPFLSREFQDVIYKFTLQYPHINMRCYLNDTLPVYELLAKEKNNSAVGILNLPYYSDSQSFPEEFIPPAGYKIIPYYYFRYDAILSTSSHLAKHKKLSLSTLLKEPLIILSTSDAVSSTALFYWLKKYDQPYNVYFSTPSIENWKSALADNKGISMSAGNTGIDLSTPFDNKLTFVTIKEKIEACNCLLVPTDMSTEARAFVHHIKKFMHCNIGEK